MPDKIRHVDWRDVTELQPPRYVLLPDKKIRCPYTGFAKSCFEGVTKHHCPKWVHVVGVDPNSGKAVDAFNCADAWTPLLLIENSQQQRQTGAAIESLRNEMLLRAAAGLSIANELAVEIGRDGGRKTIDVTNGPHARI